MLDYIILGMVGSGCATGYEIKKHIENNIGVFYRANFGSIYPALKKLVERGSLTMREDPQGGRQKIYYEITEKGGKEFYDWLTAPANVMEGQNTRLAKVYFFDILPPEIRERQFLEFEIAYGNYLTKLEALEKEYDSLENPEKYYYKLSTLYYGIAVTREILRWCNHIKTGKPLKNLIKDILKDTEIIGSYGRFD